jgi:hypothetical protein
VRNERREESKERERRGEKGGREIEIEIIERIKREIDRDRFLLSLFV